MSLSLGACLPVSAAASISAVGSSVDLSTQPGLATDFTLFGNPDQFTTVNSFGGTGTQPTVLNDFTVAPGANAVNSFGGNTNYSIIDAPTGSGETSINTGILFGSGGGGASLDLADFTLGTSGSSFDFSNFNVYLMYGDAHDGYEIDSSVTLTLLPPASSMTQTPLATLTLPVTDGNTNLSEATFQEFSLQGAAAGDVLEVGATGFGYLGGVSFDDAPEPPAYALIGLGLLAVVLARRLRLT